ncbi:MAG: GAF domain-containing protein [Chloroflexi bacterium]|nr:GAF domain-containing protein [Chloroflexota bacterium]
MATSLDPAEASAAVVRDTAGLLTSAVFLLLLRDDPAGDAAVELTAADHLDPQCRAALRPWIGRIYPLGQTQLALRARLTNGEAWTGSGMTCLLPPGIVHALFGSGNVDRPRLYVPLRIKDRTLGALVFAEIASADNSNLASEPGPARRRPGPRAFPLPDVTFATEIAERAAIALETAQIYVAAQRREAITRSLFQAGHALTRTTSFEEMVQRIVEAAIKVGDADAALLFQSDEEETLRGIASHGLAGLTATDIVLDTRSVERHHPADRQVIVSPEITLLPAALRPLLDAQGIQALAHVPIVIEDTLYGVLHVYYRRPHRPPEDARGILGALADQAAAAIQKQRVLEDARAAQQRAERHRAQALALAEENAQLYVATQGERAYLQSILDQLPHAILVTNSQGEISQANTAAHRLTRMSPEALQSRPDLLSVEVPGPASQREQRQRIPLIEVAQRLGPLAGAELILIGPSHRQLPVLLSAAPLHDPDGQPGGSVVVFQDISEIREVDRLKDELLAVVAHALRTPLTTIKARAQLLQRRLDRSSRREASEYLDGVTQMMEQITRLEALVDALIDASWLQLGRLDLQLERCDLAVLTREAIDHSLAGRPLAPSAIRLVEPPSPVVGLWDRPRLSIALTRLLENALDYEPAGQQVRVTISRRQAAEASFARLTVRDHSPASDDERRHTRLNDERAIDGTSVRQLNGLMLGLYVAKQIVERHGGQLWHEARPHGNLLTIELPLTSSPA